LHYPIFYIIVFLETRLAAPVKEGGIVRFMMNLWFFRMILEVFHYVPDDYIRGDYSPHHSDCGTFTLFRWEIDLSAHCFGVDTKLFLFGITLVSHNRWCGTDWLDFKFYIGPHISPTTSTVEVKEWDQRIQFFGSINSEYLFTEKDTVEVKQSTLSVDVGMCGIPYCGLLHHHKTFSSERKTLT
jgi:hypothetical protein